MGLLFLVFCKYTSDSFHNRNGIVLHAAFLLGSEHHDCKMIQTYCNQLYIIWCAHKPTSIYDEGM